jgi:hypothetical protein
MSSIHLPFYFLNPNENNDKKYLVEKTICLEHF